MSFLKISDPKKIDFITEEFLETKKKIQDGYLSKRLGDIDIHREMSNLIKPIIEAQRDVKESLLGELRPIKEKLPAITFPQLQPIEAKISILAVCSSVQQQSNILDCLPASRKLIKRLVFMTRAKIST